VSPVFTGEPQAPNVIAAAIPKVTVPTTVRIERLVKAVRVMAVAPLLVAGPFGRLSGFDAPVGRFVRAGSRNFG
jgi:hypothetical protein